MNAITKGKAAAAKVAAGYAMYLSAKKTAEQVTDMVCHTWMLDSDYLPGEFEAATQVVREHMFTLPVQRENFFEHQAKGDTRLNLINWTFVNIPGIPFLQAKANGSYITFRTLRRADINTLRTYIEARVEEECDALEFLTDDFDFGMTQTNLWSWSNGSWEHRKARNARSFKSVFLPAELQSEIEEDLKRFTASRDRLLRLELPWRRGYLFAGPPGTGKTSLSLAIAGSLNFNLASLSLTDITSDGMLRDAVSKLRPRTVLVIEDIDAYSVSRDRDHNTSTDGKLSLSGLLNSLDGFETPDGLVTIATTNHPEHLDPALVRSGRLDRTFTLDYIAAAELERLHAWFYEGVEGKAPVTAPPSTFSARMAPAQVAELFKQHLNDPQGGWDAVLAHVEEARPRLEWSA